MLHTAKFPLFLAHTHSGWLEVEGTRFKLKDMFNEKEQRHTEAFTAEQVVQAYLKRVPSLKRFHCLSPQIEFSADIHARLEAPDQEIFAGLVELVGWGPIKNLTLGDIKRLVKKPMKVLLVFLAKVEAAALKEGIQLASNPGSASPTPKDKVLQTPLALSDEDYDRAEALLAKPWVRGIQSTDLRLRRLVLPKDPHSWALHQLQACGTVTPIPLLLLRFLARLEELDGLTLHEEVTDVIGEALAFVTNTPSPGELETDVEVRALKMSLERLNYGLSGQPTLATLGVKHGVTRERVRQVTSKVERILSGLTVLRPISIATPKIDVALEQIRAMAPCTVAAAQTALQDNFVKGGSVVALLELALLMRKDMGFYRESFAPLEQKGGLPSEFLQPVKTVAANPVVACLREELTWYGATNLPRLVGLLALRQHPITSEAELVAVLEALPGFRWLGGTKIWLTAGNTARGTVGVRLRKLLEVARHSVDAEALAGAIAKYDEPMTSGGGMPPSAVLLDLACGWPGVERSHSRRIQLVAGHASSLLTPNERALVKAMTLNNGAMPVSSLVQVMQNAGLQSPAAISHWLSKLPFLTRVSRGNYALVGWNQPEPLIDG